jgi:pSer/pThr/pTyr-binding forkhead associated (FHA) protein
MTDTKLLLKKVSDGRTVALSGEVLVGRKPPAAVLLTEGQASKRHAMLVVSAEGVTVEDLNSTNGTYVNGRRIAGKVRLSDGDRVSFDTEEYQLVVQRPVDADKTLMRPSAPAEPPAVNGPGRQAKPQSTADAGKVDAVSSGSGQRSPGWINPESNKTEYIDPRKLKDGPVPVLPPSRVESADAPYLIVCSGASNGRQFRLVRNTAEQQEWTVGSDSGRDVRLGDSGVSGLHARIVNEGARWKVVDEMSANGTFVNGKRSPVSFLASGDRLRFGQVECLLQLPRTRVATSRVESAQGTSWRRTAIVVTVTFVLTAVLVLVAYLLLR